MESLIENKRKGKEKKEIHGSTLNQSKDVSYLLTNPKWSLTLVLKTKTRLHLTIDIQYH
jgi:hypothetical protein